jgi:hypothetical protein
MPTSPLPFITAILILLYIPLVCYYDIWFRGFKFNCWIPLIIVGIAYLAEYILESPTKNLYMLGFTFLLIGILLCISLFKGMYGADVFFATFIMLFVQYNPFIYPRVFFALDFFWTLLLLTCCLPIPIFIYNKWKRMDWDDINKEHGYGVIKMFTHIERGFPYLVIISLAYVLTLLMEMIPFPN